MAQQNNVPSFNPVNILGKLLLGKDASFNPVDIGSQFGEEFGQKIGKNLSNPQNAIRLAKTAQESGVLGSLISVANAGEPGPNESLVQKEIDKQKKEEITNSLKIKGPEKVLSNARQMDQKDLLGGLTGQFAQAAGQGASSVQQTPSEQAPEGSRLGPLQALMRLLIDPGSTEQGNFRMPSALGGLIKPGFAEQASLQQMAGEQPLQKGDREKLGIQREAALELQGFKDVNAFQREQLKLAAELGKQGSLKPNELFTKFETASKPFIVQRDAFSRMLASASDPSPAGDLALIFNFMKLLDPGSTVREGEFANAQNSGSVPQKIAATYNSIINGKRLSAKQRVDFVNRSKKLFGNAQKQFAETDKGFRQLAKKNNIDPQRVFRDLGLAQEKPKQAEQAEGVITTPGGNKFRRIS